VQVGLADRRFGALFNGIERRGKDREQQRNDCDYDEKLDKCERLFILDRGSSITSFRASL